jgi:deoxyribonuclease-1-like protein
MRSIVIFTYLLLSFLGASAQTDTMDIASWNIQNLGKSKSECELQFVSTVINKFDVIAIQEVSTSAEGPKAVSTIVKYLEGDGSCWKYIVSEPTTGNGSERYAYIYRGGNMSY